MSHTLTLDPVLVRLAAELRALYGPRLERVVFVRLARPWRFPG